MADECDRAQQYEEVARAAALSMHLQQHAHHLPGLAKCCECGEPISEMRRHDGARLCIDCATDAEERERRLRHSCVA